MPTLDWSPIARALDEVEAALVDAESTSTSAAKSLTDAVDQVISQNQPGILDALIGAVSAAGELASGLLESLADTDDILSALWAKIYESWPTTAQYILALMGDATLSSSLTVGASWGSALDEGNAGNGSTKPGSILRPDNVGDVIGGIDKYPAFVRNLMYATAFFTNVLGIQGALTSGSISALQQAALNEVKPTPLGLGQLTELVKRRDVTVEWARNHAGRSGYTAELFDLAQKLEQQRLTAGMYAEHLRRTGDQTNLDELTKLGLSPEDVNKLITLSLAEATPSDVVRFLARDVLDPKAIRDGNLHKDFDQKYNETLFNKAGVSKELARHYWAAHWQLPSPTQGYQMLYRAGMTIPELRALLEYADYAPAYVDKLIKIAYNVPGRIDLRRMWEAGVITSPQELEQRYMHLGYEQPDAALLAGFSIKLADAAKARKQQQQRAPLAAQIIRSYSQGTLSESEASTALVDLGFPQHEADYKLREGDLSRAREQADRIRDAIGRMYVRGKLSESETRDRLAGYGFSATEVDFNLSSWTIDRELRDLTEAEQHERDLSRADIVAAFDRGIMDSATAFASLMALGYDAQEVDTILSLAVEKQRAADAKLAQDTIKAQYVARRIERDEASARLDQAGTIATRRDALLDRWTVEREEKQPDLPISWLERLIFNGLIPQEDARAELARRGYSEQEIDWSLRLWGEELSVARERLEQQKALAEARLEQQAQQAAARISVQERALALRDRTATTAQVLQQERFQQTLEQRERLQAQRIDAQAAGRVQAAALAAQRDAERFAQSKQAQATAIAAADARLQRQIEAAAARQEDAQQQANELQSRRESLTLQIQDRTDARQTRALETQLKRLQVQLDAANAKAQAAADLRLELQARSQDFANQQRVAREAFAEADRIAKEAARIRQESRAEATRVRQEERQGARRTIERTEAAIQAESLRSLQLQRDSLIAELNASLAALEAAAAEDRIALAESQQREAQDRLNQLVGPSLIFDPGV